jgi:Ca2+-binding EF-hand superfamily protein
MKHLGEEFNPDDVQQILMEVDKDGSGHLDVEEFEVLVNKVLKPETEQFNA